MYKTEIYAAVDALILPSHVEGLGLVLLEAMACEKPVIACDTTGIKEVVQNEINGLLVVPKKPTKLTKAITRVFKDGQLRKKLIAGGRNLVDSKFNATRQVAELEEIYANI